MPSVLGCILALPGNPRTASNPNRRCVAGTQPLLRLRYTLVLGGRLYASQVPGACRFARLHPGLLLGALPGAAVHCTRTIFCCPRLAAASTWLCFGTGLWRCRRLS